MYKLFIILLFQVPFATITDSVPHIHSPIIRYIDFDLDMFRMNDTLANPRHPEYLFKVIGYYGEEYTVKYLGLENEENGQITERCLEKGEVIELL